MEHLLENAKVLANTENFEQKVNSREFELEITKIASSYKVDKELKELLIKQIDNNYRENKKLSFVLFFILFTICRRQNFGNILELTKEYENMFNDYEITKHINLMAVLVKGTDSSTIYKTIKSATRLVTCKNEICDFTIHTGILNAYTELICKYFEYQLDEKSEPENIEILQNGLVCINKAIEIDAKEKGSKELVYSKFYLNRGRLLILLEKYAKGEADIIKAIELLPPSADRESKVSEYNQYLVKSSIIHAYDLNEDKVRDLDKIKVSNYKSIALMTTLLGFLLGTINIFTTIENTFTLSMLMLAYCGLLFILLGVVLLGFSLNLKERKKRLYVYDAVLIIIGIIIFVSVMIILNK